MGRRPRGRAATATSDGPADRTHGAVEERGRARLQLLQQLRSRKGQELEAIRRPRPVHRPGIQVRVEGPVGWISPQESDAYWATRAAASRRSAAASHQSKPIALREALEAAVAEIRSSAPRPSTGAVTADSRRTRVLAAPRRPPPPTSPFRRSGGESEALLGNVMLLAAAGAVLALATAALGGKRAQVPDAGGCPSSRRRASGTNGSTRFPSRRARRR